MAFLMLVIAIAAFLSGAAAAAFIMLVAGIRKADRPHRPPSARSTPLDAVTRATLGTGRWPGDPAHRDPEAG